MSENAERLWARFSVTSQFTGRQILQHRPIVINNLLSAVIYHVKKNVVCAAYLKFSERKKAGKKGFIDSLLVLKREKELSFKSHFKQAKEKIVHL